MREEREQRRSTVLQPPLTRTKNLATKKNGCCVKEKADCKRKGPGVKEKGLV